MNISVLGPVVVTGAEGSESAPSAARDRAFLGELLVHTGSFVSSDHLAEQVWGRRPTSDPLNAVQVRVSRLRRLFRAAWGEDGDAVIVTKPGGYVLALDRRSVDGAAFEDLVRDARRRRRYGDRAGALAGVERALALWRGAPFADSVDTPCLAAEARRLQELRTATRELHAELLLELGRAEDVVGGLCELTGRHPMREHAHVLLMRALRSCGRPAEALLVYEGLRGRLAEQLGVDPGEQVQALYRALLTGRAATKSDGPAPGGAPTRSKTPPRTETATRTGVPDRIAAPARVQVPARARASDAAPEPEAAAASGSSAGSTGTGVALGHLHSPLHFVGRAGPLRTVERVLLDARDTGTTRAVAVSGMPGVGKSALTAIVSYRLRERFPDGRVHLQLGAHRPCPPTPARVLRQALIAMEGAVPEHAHAMSTDARDLGVLTARLRRAVAGRRVLFVLDDVAGAAQLRPLLEPLSGCAVLATSTTPLTSLDGFTPLRLGPLSPSDSVALLGALAGTGRRTGDVAAMERIAALCGHLPLALRVIGARLAAHPTLSPADLADALLSGEGRLDELDFDDLSVRGSLASGYRDLARAAGGRGRLAARLLPLIGRRRLRTLTPASAGQLLEAGPMTGAAALEGLAAVGFAAAGSPGAYEVHPLVQHFAREIANGLSAATPVDVSGLGGPGRHRRLRRPYAHGQAHAHGSFHGCPSTRGSG
ncbi:BTAD domain-containing putative transcriptional regulator [Streptomyces sp. NPDC097704]|uniref:AfsR/SARP family transcriptional regulator n=1 Tax=Streptomyces sp. NPDC097704 TaxID=3157101 RepID=UPI003316FC5D